MVEAPIAPILSEAAGQVLETMFFTEIVGEKEAVERCHRPLLRTRLRFRGDPSGRSYMCVPVETARAIAANFLGLEEQEVSEAQAIQVVCELSNMICGAVLSRLEKDTTWAMEAPELVEAEDPVPEENSYQRCFELDKGTLEVRLDLLTCVTECQP